MTDGLPVIADVRDMCDDSSFQWEFSCRRCRTSFRSPMERNLTGQGRGLLRMAGQWFGGEVARASWTADSYGHGYTSGPSSEARERHYANAVNAMLPNFRQCRQCGQWQCAQACWNAAAGLCTGCAPPVSAPAPGTRINRRCPSCRNVTGSRFCPHCGTAIPVTTTCGQCGTEAQPGATFCGDCGNRLG